MIEAMSVSGARGALARVTRRELIAPAIEYVGVLLIMAFSVTVLGIAYADGVVYWASQPVVLVAQTAAVLAAVGTGVILQLREVKGPGHWIVATGYSLALYTALQALSYALVYWGGLGDATITQVVVSLGATWWVVVLSFAQLGALAVGHYIRGVRRHRYQVFQIVYVSLVMVLFIPQGMTVYPFESVTVFLGDSLGRLEFLQFVAPILSWAWMAMLPIVPILLFWGIRKAPPGRRRPLAVAAAASVLPMTVVLICELLWLAFTPAGMSEPTGEIVLISSHALGTGLSAVVLGYALGYAHRRTPMSDRTVEFFLSAAASVLLLILAVSISIVLSLVLGAGAVFVVATITTVVAITFMSLRRRAVDAVLAHVDPYRFRARAFLTDSADRARTQPALTARDALRAALRDPDAELLLRADDRWASVEGEDADPAGAIAVPESGEPVAAVRTSAEAEGVYAACSVLRELLDRAALATSLRAQAKRLGEERERSASAAAQERRRLERNLHDGVQGRLLALALQLRQAESEDPNARLVFGEAVDSLRSAIDELRTLASGSMPERLTTGGLSSALADFCGRIPLPVTLEVTSARFRPDVEEVAYYVVSEALTNAVKHGHADAISVTVADKGGVLAIEVADDGSGGADPRAGSGLRGLGERVRAAGGQLLVSELHPHGTRVEVSLPCE